MKSSWLRAFMEFEDIKDKLPHNFVNKPGTVILIDDKGEPWYTQNNDGTFSGFDMRIIGMKDERAERIKKMMSKK